FIRLSISHMTHNCTFSITLTTLTLYQSSLWLFEACSCNSAPRLIYCAASTYRFYGTLIPALDTGIQFSIKRCILT
ncbi:hypothetical protein, partial [Wolbachia endosymbiont of Tettigetta isshikii]|uniref:hypothetical protein n=1 Tax=Wolbachia endosymbiont of Tettigetta isshikii TaxID=3239093 RepID=UPI00397F364F